ncbi:Caffeoyl-CoA O-methyltransferase [Rhodothermus marinus SG0.5JP17-172]|uniref:O-methyltransferase n=1 Tax=Rhodothermus marinus TaxID=29549 RepID=UPI000223DE10|nr:class I SAM-dependent methyltransferase [Rhodothermus marinus]AEN74414.1 Caffeoyl-CoA O-methyltransferase [Rhodothermus marinus SG0.5JP17-172]
MARQTLPLNDTLYDYLLTVSLREPEVLRLLRAETARHPRAEMQIAPEQGQFMALLARLIGARRALEIGVFTGYSALWVALALPPDGQLIACEVNEAYTAVARRYWEAAGVADRIALRLGPALKTLEALLAEGAAGTFDLVFIDADKETYDAYYERALELVRPGGLILLDNLLMGGRVADPSNREPSVEAIRRLNEKLCRDLRVDYALLPLADGLGLARRR